MGMVISYFDMLEGAKTLLVYPENIALTDEQFHQINKLLDVTFEKSYFTHQFDFSNTINVFIDIPSEWARGKKESVLVSLLNDSRENLDNWKAALEEFTIQLENIPEIYKGFHYFSPRFNQDVENKFQELKILTKNFYDSIPETITVQRIVKLFMFGLDRAGKTSISKRITDNLFQKTSPTLWLNVHNFQFQNFQFVCFDMGGQQQFRSFWKNYLHNSDILIFVLDGTRPERLSEAKSELWNILQISDPNIPLLILNNKADMEGHLENESIVVNLSLNQLDRPWHIVATSAKSGLGIPEALDFISKQLTEMNNK